MIINIEKIKKISIVILTIIIGCVVIYALYINKSRFYSSETVKYSQVKIDETTDIDDVISKYSDQDNKEIFIIEVKKINKLSSLDNNSVYGKMIYIPIMGN
jgi:hypothetical protein